MEAECFLVKGVNMSRIILMLLIINLVACSSKPTLKSKQADIYFGAGTQSLMEQNYTMALQSLLKANELNPDNSDILNNLGMAYYFKGEKDLAIKTLNRSLDINSSNSDAKVNLASIYYREKNFSNAERLYKEVLKDLTYDKQARNLYNLGILEAEIKKNHTVADEYFKRSIKEDENFCPSYYQLGLSQYNRRQFNSAVRNFKEATMGICYDSPAPHYYQGLAFLQMRQFLKARLKFDEVETKFKKSPFARQAHVKILEINELEANDKTATHQASRTTLESPEF